MPKMEEPQYPQRHSVVSRTQRIHRSRVAPPDFFNGFEKTPMAGSTSATAGSEKSRGCHRDIQRGWLADGINSASGTGTPG